MKPGPFTFQCACFICICSSAASARRRFINAFSSDWRSLEMSFSVSFSLVAYAGVLAFIKPSIPRYLFDGCIAPGGETHEPA